MSNEDLPAGFSDRSVRLSIYRHLQMSLKTDPGESLSLNEMGRYHLFIGRTYDSAIYYFQRALAADSAFLPAWSNLGITCDRLGDYPRSLYYYEMAKRLEKKAK